MTFTVELKGLAALHKRMAAFPEKLREAAGRKAARKAMGIVRKAARDNLAQLRIDNPNSPEIIAKNVWLQQSRRQSLRIGGVVMRVGISGGARRPIWGKPDPNADAQPGGDTRHWRYVEFGVENVAARPFLRPALENNASAVFATLQESLSKEIDKLAKL